MPCRLSVFPKIVLFLKCIDDALKQGMACVSKTLRNIKSFCVENQKVSILRGVKILNTGYIMRITF